ncbi:MAG: ribose-phosphate diphosphokinase [Patescibacteria group bacterium]
MKNGELMVLSGSASVGLAREICGLLKLPMLDPITGYHHDGEVKVNVPNVRGHDVFVVQSTYAPADNLRGLLLSIDALKRASARRITAVVPYFGYARQDKKAQRGVPISAKRAAREIEEAGAHRVLTMDLHAPQIQGFFEIPVDHIYALPVLVPTMLEETSSGAPRVVLCGDAGSRSLSKALARMIGARRAFGEKERPEDGIAEVIDVVGNVDGCVVYLIDDMICTAGTFVENAIAVAERGAVEIIMAATHGLFSYNDDEDKKKWAADRIDDSPIDRVVVANTVPIDRFDFRFGERPVSQKVVEVSVADILARAIYNINHEKSVSSLFPKELEHM